MADAKLAIRGVRLARSRRICDVIVDHDGAVAGVSESIGTVNAEREIDGAGCLLLAGLVDLRTELGEPGRPDRETIASITHAAALGGYTAIVASPFCDPVVDCAAVALEIQALYRNAIVDVQAAGTLTIGGQGDSMAPLGEMAGVGVRYFTDHSPVADDELLLNILRYASSLPITVGLAPDTPGLTANAVMHEGAVSARLGLAGAPIEAEEIGVERILGFVRLTGARVHFESLTSPRSIASVRAAAENDGLNVTCDVTVPHLLFSDNHVGDFDTLYKIDSPLRDDQTRQRLVDVVYQGDVDALVSGHAPRTSAEKAEPFDLAAAGVASIQVAINAVAGDVGLDAAALNPLMACGPAAIAGLEDRHGGPVVEGKPANVIVVDPEQRWVLDETLNASLAPNSPFLGREHLGKVLYTIRNGDVVVDQGEVVQ